MERIFSAQRLCSRLNGCTAIPKMEVGTIYLCNCESTRKDGITFRRLFVPECCPGTHCNTCTLREGRKGGDRCCNVDIDDGHGLPCRKGLLASLYCSFQFGNTRCPAKVKGKGSHLRTYTFTKLSLKGALRLEASVKTGIS